MEAAKERAETCIVSRKDNFPSYAGIRSVGFDQIGEMRFLVAGKVVFVSTNFFWKPTVAGSLISLPI
jgi:hypothetical protein